MTARCEGKVWHGFGDNRRCHCLGRYEHEGRFYCKTHHPPTVKAKDEARTAAFNVKWKAERAAQIADRVESLLATRALAWMREHHPDVVEGWKGEGV